MCVKCALADAANAEDWDEAARIVREQKKTEKAEEKASDKADEPKAASKASSK